MTNSASYTITAGDPGDPLLVLLHGGGANAEIWDDHLSSLSDTYRVVAVDLPGHRNHPAETFTYEEAITTVRDVITEEGSPAILVGHSIGGYVASKFVEHHPDDVDAVITSGSYLNWRTGKGLLVSSVYAFVLAPLIKLGKYSEVWKSTVVSRLSHEEYDSETTSADTIHGGATAMQATAFADTWTGIEQFDGPVLIGAGTEEPFVEEFGPVFADRADATFEYMPFDGHNGPVTHPEQFVTVIDRFVRNTDLDTIGVER